MYSTPIINTLIVIYIVLRIVPAACVDHNSCSVVYVLQLRPLYDAESSPRCPGCQTVCELCRISGLGIEWPCDTCTGSEHLCRHHVPANHTLLPDTGCRDTSGVSLWSNRQVWIPHLIYDSYIYNDSMLISQRQKCCIIATCICEPYLLDRVMSECDHIKLYYPIYWFEFCIFQPSTCMDGTYGSGDPGRLPAGVRSSRTDPRCDAGCVHPGVRCPYSGEPPCTRQVAGAIIISWLRFTDRSHLSSYMGCYSEFHTRQYCRLTHVYNDSVPLWSIHYCILSNNTVLFNGVYEHNTQNTLHYPNNNRRIYVDRLLVIASCCVLKFLDFICTQFSFLYYYSTTTFSATMSTPHITPVALVLVNTYMDSHRNRQSCSPWTLVTLLSHKIILRRHPTDFHIGNRRAGARHVCSGCYDGSWVVPWHHYVSKGNLCSTQNPTCNFYNDEAMAPPRILMCSGCSLVTMLNDVDMVATCMRFSLYINRICRVQP